MSCGTPTPVVPPTPAGGANAGPLSIDSNLQDETPFACAFENGELRGWVFNVIEDNTTEADTATVVERSLGFRDLAGAWTDDFTVPAGWTLDTCETMPEDLTVVEQVKICRCNTLADGSIEPFVRLLRQVFPAGGGAPTVTEVGLFTDQTLQTPYTTAIVTESSCAEAGSAGQLASRGPITLAAGSNLVLPAGTTGFTVRRTAAGATPATILHGDGNTDSIPDGVGYAWEDETDDPIAGPVTITANGDTLVVTYTYIAT